MLWFFPSHVKKCAVIPDPNKQFKFHSFYILNRETTGHQCNFAAKRFLSLSQSRDTRYPNWRL